MRGKNLPALCNSRQKGKGSHKVWSPLGKDQGHSHTALNSWGTVKLLSQLIPQSINRYLVKIVGLFAYQWIKSTLMIKDWEVETGSEQSSTLANI